MFRWTQNCRTLLTLVVVMGALNIGFVGYHVGRCLFRTKPSHEHVMNARIEGLTSLLPERSRDDIEHALVAHNADVTAKYKAMNAERRHIERLLAAQQVDTDALRTSFTKLRALHADSQKIYQDAFTDAVAKLSRAERHRVTRKMKQRHPVPKDAARPLERE